MIIRVFTPLPHHRRRPRLPLFVAAALTALAVGATLRIQPALADDAALPSRDELHASLRTTCELRMQELKRAAQERLAAVKWERDDTGVRGDYVDYSPEYVCGLSPASGDTPVGRMEYQEIRFQKRGTDVSTAMEALPVPTGIEQVTQVFVYRRGTWE